VRISICGSMTFIDQMEALASSLRERGLSVATPVREERDQAWSELGLDAAVRAKARYVTGYLEEIRVSDLVLVANYDKAGIAGYVGPNALIEAAFARALGKPAVFLHRPGPQPCQLEAMAMMTTCLDGDLSGFAGHGPVHEPALSRLTESPDGT
jgi:hypothetical protein